MGDREAGLATNCALGFEPGDASGDSEGKDSSVFAEVGVTKDGFREFALPLLDLREVVDNWDDVRSRLSLLRLAILKDQCRRHNQRIFGIIQESKSSFSCGLGLNILIVGHGRDALVEISSLLADNISAPSLPCCLAHESSMQALTNYA